MFIVLGLLMVPTPCFDVTVEVDPAYNLQLQAFHEGELVETIDWSNATAITRTFCGLGDWEIKSRTATECIEIIEGQRHETGEPCVWDGWVTTVTANVSAPKPEAPDLYIVATNEP